MRKNPRVTRAVSVLRRFFYVGRVFLTAVVSPNIPERGLFADLKMIRIFTDKIK